MIVRNVRVLSMAIDKAIYSTLHYSITQKIQSGHRPKKTMIRESHSITKNPLIQSLDQLVMLANHPYTSALKASLKWRNCQPMTFNPTQLQTSRQRPRKMHSAVPKSLVDLKKPKSLEAGVDAKSSMTKWKQIEEADWTLSSRQLAHTLGWESQGAKLIETTP